MIKSMTAFGRSQFSLNNRAYSLEIQSVNRKGLEIVVSLPAELAFLEIFLKMRLKDVCQRGHVSCKILSDAFQAQKISTESMKKIHEHLVTVAKEIDSNYQVTFEHVLEVALNGGGGRAFVQNEVESTIEIALNQAVNDFLAMRQIEGNALQKDLSERLDKISQACKRISEMGLAAPERMKQRITERLKELPVSIGDDQERILKEVIIYADKSDISEELTRLRSHIDQMGQIIHETGDRQQEAVGRTLEFILQEMMREINTTSAKSQEMEIISEAIFVKREIEKIREQVQNIE